MTSTGFTFSTPSAGGTAAPTGGFSFGGTGAVGTTGSTGFGFGASTAPGTSTGTTGFNFGGTGATGTAISSTGFPFGGGTSGTTTAASPFGSTFGAGTSSAGQSFNFGTTTSQANKPAFGFGFGNPPASGGSNFLLGSSTFGPKPSTGFGTQDANQQLQFNTGQPDPSLALHLAICAPSYFNNENDEVLRKWNQLQAFWGAGKGYYAQNMPPIEFTPENPYCRFKTVCYAKIPHFKNEDGILHVVIGKSISDVEPHKSQIISTLSSTVFNGAEVVIDDIYASELPEKTNLRMYVQQQAGNGEKQRAPATEVCRHMGLPAYSQTMKNLCVLDVLPLQTMSEAQKKEYLETPQRGIDPALWEQGKRENPDPKNFLPVVRIGFQELQKQFKYQEEFAKSLHSSMDNILEEISQLKHKQTIVKAAIQNAKWKQSNLTRRILKLVSAQEVERKRGVPLDQTEEQIRMRLEDLYLQLMQPTQYRGCLNELMAQMSVKPGNSRGNPRYGLVGDKEKDITQYIAKQQDALKAVVSVLREDMQSVDTMREEIQRKG
ncbi:nucleoporin p54-like isoform X2 [Palaemon carinicauda]|uniref:nucleoporin p54-like isoform X2 n=1 Tax=Palaemon carinicauda TaxID=392227 RepID=UPI0035B64E2C